MMHVVYVVDLAWVLEMVVLNVGVVMEMLHNTGMIVTVMDWVLDPTNCIVQKPD